MQCAIYNNLQFAHGTHEVVSDSLPDGGDGVVLGEREMLLDALRDVACEAQGERPAVQAIALHGRADPFELPAAVLKPLAGLDRRAAHGLLTRRARIALGTATQCTRRNDSPRRPAPSPPSPPCTRRC